MTERSVLVRLKADTSAFTAKMVAAGRTAETAFLASSSAAEKNRAALRTVGNAAGIMGAAAAAGVGIAIKSAADFDKAMSGVNAATHASAGAMERMRGLALKMGADTVFSATEAADGIEQLSKAGVSVGDIMRGGLKGALSLAAAGEIEVGDAAEAAASAMSQFGLKGKDVPHIADLLAAAAGKAQGEVGDFSMALNQSGLVANQTGLTIEETTGALAAFAHQGLIGSDAGTSLKTMLQSLTPSSTKAKEAMDQFNISAYDQQGNFIGLEKWAGKLKTGLSGMSDEQRNATLKTVFGSDAVRAASVIYEEGAGGVGKWVDKVNDAGYAADTAARKQDNLAGDIEKLQGALSTLLIETGESGQGPLRSVTQSVTGAVDAFNGLPGPVKTATLAFGGLVAVTGGAAFLGSRFLASVAEAKLAMTQLGISANVTKGAVRGLGVAAVAFGGYELVKYIQDLANGDDPKPRLDAVAQGLLHINSASRQTRQDVLPAFDDLGQAVDRLAGYSEQGVFETLGKRFVGAFSTTKLSSLKGDVTELDKALAGLVDSRGPQAAATALRSLAKAKGLDAEQTKALLSMLPQYRRALRNAGGASDENTQATHKGTDAVDDETSALQDNIRAHNQRAHSLLASIDKQLSWKQALIDGRKEAREGTKTLNLNTQAGIDNKTSLVNTANAWKELTDKQKRAEGGIDAARKEFVKQAMQMGANREQAQRLAKQLLDIPDVKRKVEVDTNGARRDTDAFTQFFRGALSGIKDEQVNVQLSGLAKLALQGQGPISEFEFGGPIPGGMGVRGRDSVRALLMPDEHVVTTKEVLAAGKGSPGRGHRVWQGIRHAALVGALPDPMDLPAYAGGGAVTPRVGQSGFPAALRTIEAAFGGVVDQLGEQLSERINKMYRFGGGAPLGPGGNLSRGQIMMGQRFAQAQAGKPYIWGGVGPAGYDCSGYQSAITNAALGRNPYQRIGSTGTMPWPGMGSGTGLYTIGWFTGDPGHTSGNIGGLNVESTGDHVRNGSAARSPLDSMFNHVGHYDTGGPLHPGWTAAFNGTGDTEYVVKGFAEGGKVTKSERQANREERQARQQEREKQARQDASAFARALTQFDFSHVEKMGRDDVRSELRDLRGALRDILGKDAPILKTLDKLDDRMDKQARQQAKLVKSEENLTESLKSLKGKRDEYAASVAGTFRNEIYGGGLDDLSLQLRADTNDAKAMRRALKLAEHKGLSGGLYSGLAASGNLLLAQQFAHLSRQQIARYEHLYAGRQGATGALGRTAGAEVYGQRVHENSRALHRVHHRLGENTRQMRKLGRTIEKRARRSDSGAHKRARTG